MGSPSRAPTSYRTALSARAVVLASSRHVSYHLDSTGESVNRLFDWVIRFDGGDALNGLSSRFEGLHYRPLQRGTWLVTAGSPGGSHPGGSHAPVLQNAS